MEIKQSMPKPSFIVIDPRKMEKNSIAYGSTSRADRIRIFLQDKIAPFEIVERKEGVPFYCFCGASGTKPIVVKDSQGKLFNSGGNCLLHLGLSLGNRLKPKSVNPTRVLSNSKEYKFIAALAKYASPFTFVRKEVVQFTCLCGGRGINKLVIKDANDLEFGIGESCACRIPGIVITKNDNTKESLVKKIKLGAAKGSIQIPSFGFVNNRE